MSKPFIALLAAVAAIAMVAAGCGGSDDSTETTSELTKVEFVKQGNAICAKFNKEVEAEFERFAKEKNLSQNEQLSEAALIEGAEEFFVPMVKRQINELRALDAPSAEEQKVDKIFSAAEKALAEGEENPSLFLAEDGGPFKEANKLARDYGLTDCG
ncbi:MAG TPA: hypothetical protein VGV69_07955 [Solirubrobacterales bacterium]|nr:hypothetical protein [Solirubrobacterales bacterium]